MKNTFLATLIAMLFALSFVSCDKADNPWGERDRFFVNNLSSYYLRFEGLYPSIIPHDCEVIDMMATGSQGHDIPVQFALLVGLQ